MSLEGKGFMIWKINSCERGHPESIAAAAQSAGLTNVLIKVADSSQPYNVDRQRKIDLVPPVVQALKRKGIQVWGWHFVYGNDPLGEARIGIKRVHELGLDGYIIDAEGDYKHANKTDNALIYMKTLRSSLNNIPIALSSYRFPRYHPQLPWQVFLDRCDFNMPQVYWEKAHNPAAQLKQCIIQFQSIKPFRPIIPTGPVYKVGDWVPTQLDIMEFMNTARSLGLKSVNFFTWDYARTILSDLWNIISAYKWGLSPLSQDVTDLYFMALNTYNADMVINLFKPDAVLVTSERTIQGKEQIKSWYQSIFSVTFPKATFELTGISTFKNSKTLSWKIIESDGTVHHFNDTVGIVDNQIAYFYSNLNLVSS
ncbi:MAG: nuclear transport factor 2 family protein [Anaerolineaceae bacterium]|nr:nuclear transport factor 2 family protein [Anaerolineaceae bacterium]